MPAAIGILGGKGFDCFALAENDAGGEAKGISATYELPWIENGAITTTALEGADPAFDAYDTRPVEASEANLDWLATSPLLINLQRNGESVGMARFSLSPLTDGDVAVRATLPVSLPDGKSSKATLSVVASVSRQLVSEAEEKKNNAVTVTVRQIRKLPAEWQAISGFVDEEAEEKVPKQSFAISFALPRAGAEGKQFDASVTELVEDKTGSPGSGDGEAKAAEDADAKAGDAEEGETEDAAPPASRCAMFDFVGKAFLGAQARTKVFDLANTASSIELRVVRTLNRVVESEDDGKKKKSAEPAETVTEITDAVADIELEDLMRAGCTKIVVECPLRWVKPESKATAADSAEEGQADAKEDGEEGKTAGGESAEGEDIADEEEKAAEPTDPYGPVGTYIVVEVSLAKPLVATEDEETKTLTDVVVAASPPIPTYLTARQAFRLKVQEAVGDITDLCKSLQGNSPSWGGRDSKGPSGFGGEQRRKLLYALNTTGAYVDIKERLKLAIVSMLSESQLMADYKAELSRLAGLSQTASDLLKPKTKSARVVGGDADSKPDVKPSAPAMWSVGSSSPEQLQLITDMHAMLLREANIAVDKIYSMKIRLDGKPEQTISDSTAESQLTHAENLARAGSDASAMRLLAAVLEDAFSDNGGSDRPMTLREAIDAYPQRVMPTEQARRLRRASAILSACGKRSLARRALEKSLELDSSPVGALLRYSAYLLEDRRASDAAVCVRAVLEKLGKPGDAARQQRFRIAIAGPPGSGATALSRELGTRLNLVPVTLAGVEPGEWADTVAKKVAEATDANGWILDGVPASADDVKRLSGADLTPDAVILVDMDRDTAKQAYADTRVDSKTGTVYNIKTNPPPEGLELPEPDMEAFGPSFDKYAAGAAGVGGSGLRIICVSGAGQDPVAESLSALDELPAAETASRADVASRKLRARAYALLAASYAQSGDAKRAARFFAVARCVQAEGKGNPPYRGADIPSVYLDLADYLLETQLLSTANLVLEQPGAKAAGPSGVMLRVAGVQRYAKSYRKATEAIEGALAAMGRAAEGTSAYLTALALAGNASYEGGQRGDAFGAFERYMSWGTADPDVLVCRRYAEILISEKRFDEGLQVALRWCGAAPSAESWLAAGACALRLGDLASAKRALTCANELDRENESVWGLLALMALLQGKVRLAEASLEQATRLGMSDSDLLVDIAREFVRCGELGRGVATAKQALACRDSPRGRLVLAEAYASMGRLQEFAEEFRMAERGFKAAGKAGTSIGDDKASFDRFAALCATLSSRLAGGK